jgi:dihydroorotase
VRIFSDDGDAVADEDLLREAMLSLKALEDGSVDGSVGLISQHAEDRSLCADGHMHEGSVSRRLGVAGLPARGEEAIVERDLELVAETGCRYHVQHVSTRGTVDLIRQAKSDRLPVTAEVTPHHLAFDHTSLATLDSVFKMYPPLREPEDVRAVRTALAEGIIDIVATDHAPHTQLEKEAGFTAAPRGVIGLETAAAVVNTLLGFDAATFFDRLALGPRRIMHRSDAEGLVAGSPADVVVFDPATSWTVESFRSKSSNSPWHGSTLQGCVVATFVAGKAAYQADRVTR